MSAKLRENSLKYFGAISENKRKDLELRYQESQIDRLQKKMLTRYWKDKISIFDEMIRLNVKTPTYDSERALQDYMSEKGGKSGDKYTCSMGPMNIDSKLLSNRPVSLQRGKKPGTGLEPVISIEGTDAVCYPTKEARKGRKVGLNAQVLRRMEQCKALEDSITSIHTRDEKDRESPGIQSFRRNGSPVRRPKTAPRPGGKHKSKTRRPETSVARLCPQSTLVTEFKHGQSETDNDRSSTSMSSPKLGSVSGNSLRPGTSLSSRHGVSFADTLK